MAAGPVGSVLATREDHKSRPAYPKNRRNTSQAISHTVSTWRYRSFGVWAAWAAREGYSVSKWSLLAPWRAHQAGQMSEYECPVVRGPPNANRPVPRGVPDPRRFGRGFLAEERAEFGRDGSPKCHRARAGLGAAVSLSAALGSGQAPLSDLRLVTGASAPTLRLV